MARPAIKTVNIKNMKELVNIIGNVVDYYPILAYTMKNCGATYSEIAEVFGISNQLADYYVNNIRKALGQWKTI